MKAPKVKELNIDLDKIINIEFDISKSNSEDLDDFPDFLDANVIYAEIYDEEMNIRPCKPRELDFINQDREFVFQKYTELNY